jgi:hypothetical protein
VITEFFEHFANAAAIAGESSAVPFEERYLDGMMQDLLLGGGFGEDPEANLIVKARSQGSRTEDFIAMDSSM